MLKKFYVKLVVSIVIVTVLFTQVAYSTNNTVDIDYFKSILNMIQEKYAGEITQEELIQGALRGMFNVMDDYTTYLDAEEANDFFNSMSGSYQGIGIMISKEGEYTVVSKVFPDSPAHRMGIEAGDKIVEVSGENVVGASLERVVSLIRGKEGTAVSIGILRSGQKSIQKIEVTREEITLNPVQFEIRGDIGYIKIDTFNLNTEKNFKEALRVLDENRIKKIILDLRDNPGGELNQAVAVAGELVPAGLITELVFRSDEDRNIKYFSYLEQTKYEVAVLINNRSASAAEIVAGAIQDTNTGIIIGTPSYGKAEVQNMIPIITPQAFEKYSRLLGKDIVDAYELVNKHNITLQNDEIIGWSKITVGRYTTPTGRIIDKNGIIPDIYVENYNDIYDIYTINKMTKTHRPNLGERSSYVYNAKKILQMSGYVTGELDSELDEKTFVAIAKFQGDQGLYPYGVLDFITQKRLNEQLENLIIERDRQYAEAVEVLR